MASVELKDVSFRYGESSDEHIVLDRLNLTIHDGEFICILGRSGCGKSTLLRLISGLNRPLSGQVLINGSEVAGPTTGTAVVFQNYTLFPWMKVRKNVEFGIRQAGKIRTKTEIRERAEEYLRRVEMIDSADKYPCQLSGGMKQRVAIARALAMDADLLLMDEPFGALDARTRRNLRHLLETLWLDSEKRRTVIMVTHDVSEAVKMADRIVFMTPGQIEKVIESTLPRPREPIAPGFADAFERMKREVNELFYRTIDEEQ